jgi:hypothetical protein
MYHRRDVVELWAAKPPNLLSPILTQGIVMTVLGDGMYELYIPKLNIKLKRHESTINRKSGKLPQLIIRLPSDH